MTIVPDLDAALAALAPGATVVDFGCHGWLLADGCANNGHHLTGVDRREPSGRPSHADYRGVNNGVVDLPDDYASITVASHVLEHIAEPVGFFQELMRITKPGGTLWIEAPSELSAKPQGSDDPLDHRFESFWDDPTHIRPWTPGALYRLALTCQCIPQAIYRVVTGGIPSVRMLGRKPPGCIGAPNVSYVSLRGVPPGLDNAWRHVWGGGP